MTEQAIIKLEKELADIKNSDRKINVVKTPVTETLIGFCRQDEEFAQAIVQSDKTLGDCLREVMGGVGNAISDIETYRSAVQFYFPGSDIRMTMTIDLCASVKDDDDTEGGSSIVLDLADFL